MQYHSVDGDFFSWPYSQLITGLHLIEGDVLFASVGAQAAGRLRTEIQQSANSSAGTAASAQFHDLSQQDQRGDGGGGFEIDVWIAGHAAQGGGKDVRSDRRDDAVTV